ncbi:MAG: MarC family protein [Acetobacteraceae bacterium]|nr:MarC family protein [Acetobacteraceae bacterium]
MSAVAAFLLAFPALFSIVNPPGGAFIFHEVTADLERAARTRLARRVGMYSLLVMLVALWGGAYVLNFFGISLGALRIAGGAVVALRAWDLLMSPERQEQRKSEQAGSAVEVEDGIAFFPLTMPLTTGPGTISVAIALGAERPSSGEGLLEFLLGVSTAALAIALLVWLSYRSADRVADVLGAAARRTISRMSAFLLLCIGVQVMLTGAEDEIHRIASLLIHS